MIFYFFIKNRQLLDEFHLLTKPNTSKYPYYSFSFDSDTKQILTNSTIDLTYGRLQFRYHELLPDLPDLMDFNCRYLIIKDNIISNSAHIHEKIFFIEDSDTLYEIYNKWIAPSSKKEKFIITNLTFIIE